MTAPSSATPQDDTGRLKGDSEEALALSSHVDTSVELDGYIFLNGKARLDKCYVCGESKAAVRYSQQDKNPIYCVTGTSGEYGFEVDQEYDHHTFTLTEKVYQSDLASELEMLNQMDGFVEFMKSQEQVTDLQPSDGEVK